MPNSNNGKTKLGPTQHMVGACMHAAYFMDGMSESAQQLYDWRERTNTGHVDMVSELAVHAVLLAELEEKAAEVVGGIYSGVFDYEVSEFFGKWFALQCITNDSMPTDEEVRQYLAAETYSFFSQGPVDDETRAQLREVLGIKDRGSIGIHDWVLGKRCEDGIPVFVDDRQLSYRKTPEQAKAYALEIIARLQADGDYRLNDKPAGFLPPALGRG